MFEHDTRDSNIAIAKKGAAEQQHNMAGDEADERPPVVVPEKNYGFPRDAFDLTLIPDWDTDFLSKQDSEAFIHALSASDPAASQEDASTIRLGSPTTATNGSNLDLTPRSSSMAETDRENKNGSEDAQEVAAHAAAAAADVSAPNLPTTNGNGNGNGNSQHRRDSLFITAQSDWAPVHQKVVRAGTGNGKRGERRRHKRAKSTRPGRRTKDETREGYLYNILKWPFLLFVGCWVIGLALAYVLTRYYVWFYEYFISWRGQREQLRRNVRATSTYKEWRTAAKELDEYFGNSDWREKNEFAYYDWKTVKKVWESMKKSRAMAEKVEKRLSEGKMIGTEERQDGEKAVEALRALLAACVKNNFVGVENPRLYSQTYYGTKNLVQNHVDEGMLPHLHRSWICSRY